jgi:hypothetical protein
MAIQDHIETPFVESMNDPSDGEPLECGTAALPAVVAVETSEAAVPEDEATGAGTLSQRRGPTRRERRKAEKLAAAAAESTAAPEMGPFVVQGAVRGDRCIRMGANKQENWALIDGSDGDHLWFHLDGHPSAHVVLSYPAMRAEACIDTYSDEDIMECARLCRDKAKRELREGNGRLRVVYTLIRNLSKKGCDVGAVRFKDPGACRFIKV